MRHKIYFPQFGKEKEIWKGRTILDYAKQLSIPISSSCGGLGKCKECRIAIEKGHQALNERGNLEKELERGERLVCQTIIEDPSFDIWVKVLRYGYLQILAKRNHRKVQLNPLTKKAGDKVVFDNKEIDTYRGHIYGIAADIGTTTVVLHLMDLENGDHIYTYAFENPQRITDGNDVMSRITPKIHITQNDIKAEEAAKKIKHINLELIPNYGKRLMLDEQNFRELKFP